MHEYSPCDHGEWNPKQRGTVTYVYTGFQENELTFCSGFANPLNNVKRSLVMFVYKSSVGAVVLLSVTTENFRLNQSYTTAVCVDSLAPKLRSKCECTDTAVSENKTQPKGRQIHTVLSVRPVQFM